MAKIINLERNLQLEIQLKSNDMLDIDPERSDNENWVPFTLCLDLPDRHSAIQENVKATMTISEIKDLIYGIENVKAYMDGKGDCIYTFDSSESFFGLRFESIPEDDVIEIELWINVGNQTDGKIFGFDEGVRFVVSIETINDFLMSLKEEYLDITSSRYSASSWSMAR